MVIETQMLINIGTIVFCIGGAWVMIKSHDKQLDKGEKKMESFVTKEAMSNAFANCGDRKEAHCNGVHEQFERRLTTAEMEIKEGNKCFMMIKNQLTVIELQTKLSDKAFEQLHVRIGKLEESFKNIPNQIAEGFRLVMNEQEIKKRGGD